MITDKKILLSVADGPESIEIYTSDEEGVVDWASSLPGLYLTVSLNDVSAKFGPFTLGSIRDKITEIFDANTENELLFELQRKRTAEADNLWQEATGNHDTLPDLGKLIEWLLERPKRLEKSLKDCRRLAEDYATKAELVAIVDAAIGKETAAATPQHETKTKE